MFWKGPRAWLLVIGIPLIIGAFLLWQPRKTSEPADNSELATIEDPSSAPTESAQPNVDSTTTAPGSLSTVTQSAQLIAQLLDPTQPLKVRRQVARTLARGGTDEGMTALKLALEKGPAQLKAAIAESLGESPHPDAPRLLLELAHAPDEMTARGALRGLATQGHAQAVEIISGILFDARRPESVRTEAALVLGNVSDTSALSVLTRAAHEIRDPTLTESILEGLGKRPFAETEQFFQSYLESSNRESKIAALEALANTTGDAANLLLKYASDPDAEVRSAAAWALSANSDAGNLGSQLLGLLQQEKNPEVRRRLYQALGTQDEFAIDPILSMVQSETVLSSRLAGLDLLAQTCRAGSNSDLLTYFAESAVPELKRTALGAPDVQHRLASVNTLRNAGTPESIQALHEIAQQSTDRRTVEAAQAAGTVGLTR